MRPKQGRAPVRQQQPQGPGLLQPRPPARGGRTQAQLPQAHGQGGWGHRGPGSLHTPFDPSLYTRSAPPSFQKVKADEFILQNRMCPMLGDGHPTPAPTLGGVDGTHTRTHSTAPPHAPKPRPEQLWPADRPESGPSTPGRPHGDLPAASICWDPRLPQKRRRVSKGSRARSVRSPAPHSSPGSVTDINGKSLQRISPLQQRSPETLKPRRNRRRVPVSPSAASPASESVLLCRNEVVSPAPPSLPEEGSSPFLSLKSPPPLRLRDLLTREPTSSPPESQGPTAWLTASP